MSLNMNIDEWKKGIPQRELEQKIREYEEDYPKREKMTPQARENNQTRFFLEDRFYELHKQQLADMLKKQAEENGKVCFREGYPGIIPSMNSYSDGSNVGYTPLPTSPTLGEGVDSANTGLGASALTLPSYGATGGNGGQQVVGGYGNGYAADYVQPDYTGMDGKNMFGSSKKLRTYDNSLSGAERIDALKNGLDLHLKLDRNPDLDCRWPLHTVPLVGKAFVKYYDDDIEEMAAKHGVDADLLRAVMYAENARGHYFGVNYLADAVGLSGSQAPMNIQNQWSGIDGRDFDTYNSRDNIELGAMVLKRISGTLDNPTPEKVGTLWNGTGKNSVSNFGCTVEDAYNNKLWRF